MLMNQIKQVYNNIATEFDRSRFRIWPCVYNFLSQIRKDSVMLDIGCGNGKNMTVIPELKFKGIDISDQLVNICKNKGLDVIEANMTSIPFSDCSFDGFISVACYHHLDNDQDRQKALNEMFRILKSGGRGLIVVWAMEQPSDSNFNFTKSDELVRWKNNITKEIFYRYYHIYRENELENEITRLEPKFKIINKGW
jgi:tRNA (uracil-5-)-methyltransferase TRM9